MKPDNKYLAAALDELPGYRQALDVAEQARQALTALKPPETVPPELNPLSSGKVTSEWIDATVAHRSAAALHEQRRGVLIQLERDARSTASSSFRMNVNPALAKLNAELTAVLNEVAAIADELDGATTPAEAIDKDLGAQWKRLPALHNDYRELREAQDRLMTAAPADYSMNARRKDGGGEDHASDLYIANLDEIWPQWRGRGGVEVIKLDGSPNPRREPWPTDPIELLLWLVTSGAKAWIPTLADLDQLRADRNARANPKPNTPVPGIRKPPINQSPTRVI
ncbi:hypothetical protein [Mycobacterium sp. HUMS_1102779]|uniref:hypothetical protein n=1 Tax=Mycobacterium sp. HUMS_1102779 TaxID=3383487 RepID=UPI00389991F0